MQNVFYSVYSLLYTIYYIKFITCIVFMHILRTNFLRFLSRPLSLILWLVVSSLLFLFGRNLYDFALIAWNAWQIYALVEKILFGMFVVLFGLFISLTWYKFSLFGSSSPSKTSSMWWFGWILSILVTWCSSCSITLASYIWLSSLLSFLPFGGIEVNIIWVWLLVYSCIRSTKNLFVCDMNISPKMQNKKSLFWPFSRFVNTITLLYQKIILAMSDVFVQKIIIASCIAIWIVSVVFLSTHITDSCNQTSILASFMDIFSWEHAC